MDELILLRSTATNGQYSLILYTIKQQIDLTFIKLQMYCAPYSLLTKISEKNCLFTL
jgi:hypothetical protein